MNQAPPASRPPRAPLSPRRHAARREGRRLIAARTRTPLTPAQLALDPLARGRRGGAALAIAGGAILGSLFLHLAGLGSTLLMGRLDSHQRDAFEQPVKVTVREPPPPPPRPLELPPEPADVPEPEPEKPKPKVKVARELPPDPEPTPPDGTPPPRIVGLSLDSTAEGGGGPSFAVGNTREGATAKRAVDPSKVVAGATGPIDAPPTVNQVATRLPVGGIVYNKPKQKEPRVSPVYPETLKSQSIEAIVKVAVKIDASGKVVDVKVIKAAPYPEFNDAAVLAARTQEWEPATKDGVAIESTMPYDYKFFLTESQ